MGIFPIINRWTEFCNTEEGFVSDCCKGVLDVSSWLERKAGMICWGALTQTEYNHFGREQVCLICSTCYYRSTEAFFLSWIFNLPVWGLKLKKPFSFWLIICMLASASLIVSSNFFLVLCLMVLVSLNFRLMVKVWINQWTVSKMIGG